MCTTCRCHRWRLHHSVQAGAVASFTALCCSIEAHCLQCCPAGANAGFSTILFKLLWPEATVVMLEPDPSNFAMLSRNTAT